MVSRRETDRVAPARHDRLARRLGLQRAGELDPSRVEQLYLRWLRDAAATPLAPTPAPLEWRIAVAAPSTGRAVAIVTPTSALFDDNRLLVATTTNDYAPHSDAVHRVRPIFSPQPSLAAIRMA